MKAIIAVAVFLCWPAVADEADEIKAIVGIIASLNGKTSSMSDFLTPEATDIDPAFMTDDTPWSEVTHPHIVIRSARFLSPNTAMIDGESIQYGSMIMKRSQPLILLFRKFDGKWRIACLRVQSLIR